MTSDRRSPLRLLNEAASKGAASKGAAVSGSASMEEEAASRELLSTGDMARLSDSTLRTVRFYEQEGLIAPVRRGEGERRQFPRGELLRLQLALDLREAGLSITDIKALFELKHRHPNPKAAACDVSLLLNEQIEAMQAKIAKLRALREELSAMVSVISECRSCEGERFPECNDCDVLERPSLPRAVRVLWD